MSVWYSIRTNKTNEMILKMGNLEPILIMIVWANSIWAI